MRTENFDEIVALIEQQDPRYTREAYLFVREALDHTQKIVARTGREGVREEIRHVSGQELLDGIRAYAMDQFGPMTLTLLSEWGIRRCEDFGELVFNMVEHNLLAKTKKDTREDFKGGYDFDEAFRQPFLPSAQRAAAATETKS